MFTDWDNITVAKHTGSDKRGDIRYFTHTTQVPSRTAVERFRKAVGDDAGRMLPMLIEQVSIARRPNPLAKPPKNPKADDVLTEVTRLFDQYLAAGVEPREAQARATREARNVKPSVNVSWINKAKAAHHSNYLAHVLLHRLAGANEEAEILSFENFVEADEAKAK